MSKKKQSKSKVSSSDKASQSTADSESFEIQFDLADESEFESIAPEVERAVDEIVPSVDQDEPVSASEPDAVESVAQEPPTEAAEPEQSPLIDSEREQAAVSNDRTSEQAEEGGAPKNSEMQLPFLEFEEIVEGELQAQPEPATAESTPSHQPAQIPSLNFEEALNLEGQIEALLFAASKPLKAQDIIEILHDVGEEKRSLKEVERTIQSLVRWYEEKGGGFRLESMRGMGYQFQTAPSAARLMERLFSSRPRPLSRAALETLSIIAYRQPVTRADVEYIRGVDAGSIIKNLLDRELIACVGRKEDSGRPMLFGTTDEFLKVFRLQALSDLPPLAAFQPSPDAIGKALDDLDSGETQKDVDIEPFIGDESHGQPDVSSGLGEDEGLNAPESLGVQFDEFGEAAEDLDLDAESKSGADEPARTVQGAVFHASDSKLDVESEDRGVKHDQGPKISLTTGSELPPGSGEVDTGGANRDQRQDRPATRDLD